jgi:hypothetical protein
MKKTYKGSCHCGAVRYEADLDLAEGTVKCNCSICAKTRLWLVAIKGDAFRLLAGAEDLTEYQFGSGKIHHQFCKHCGVRPFSRAQRPNPADLHYALNVSCLDDVDDSELLNVPVIFVNGRQNDFGSAPAETRHL